MNFKQLTAFCEVMLTGSISKAARNLNRTQPAVSSLIAGLEEDVGFKLFSRHGARVHSLPEAQYLFDEASEILNRLDSVKRSMESFRRFERGVIRVVSMPGPSVFLLPDIISRFVEGKESVQVTLSTRTSVQAQRLIANQQFDVGLADYGYGAAADSRLIDHEVISFEGLCAIPADDPMAEKDVITAADLNGKPLATLVRSHPAYASIRAAFDKMGADFDLRFEARFYIPMFTYVERGLAYAIVDLFSAESYRLYKQGPHRIVFRPFRPVVDLVATIMSPAYGSISNVAQAFIVEVKNEVYRMRDRWGQNASSLSRVTRPAGNDR